MAPTPQEAAELWLSNTYHRDVWRVYHAAQVQVLAIEEKYGPDDEVPEKDLELLSRFHGTCEGFQQAIEGALMGWQLDRGYPVQPSPLWEAIQQAWESGRWS